MCIDYELGIVDFLMELDCNVLLRFFGWNKISALIAAKFKYFFIVSLMYYIFLMQRSYK